MLQCAADQRRVGEVNHSNAPPSPLEPRLRLLVRLAGGWVAPHCSCRPRHRPRRVRSRGRPLLLHLLLGLLVRLLVHALRLLSTRVPSL